MLTVKANQAQKGDNSLVVATFGSMRTCMGKETQLTALTHYFYLTFEFREVNCEIHVVVLPYQGGDSHLPLSDLMFQI